MNEKMRIDLKKPESNRKNVFEMCVRREKSSNERNPDWKYEKIYKFFKSSLVAYILYVQHIFYHPTFKHFKLRAHKLYSRERKFCLFYFLHSQLFLALSFKGHVAHTVYKSAKLD